jgi:hypothetical protein
VFDQPVHVVGLARRVGVAGRGLASLVGSFALEQSGYAPVTVMVGPVFHDEPESQLTPGRRYSSPMWIQRALGTA